jgi:hypothetical protein
MKQHLHCCNYRACHAVCCVTRAVLRAIPEEAKGGAAKAQQHANTIALLEAACRIVLMLAVAPEGSSPSIHEPAICRFSFAVPSCGVKVGPADADEDTLQQ